MTVFVTAKASNFVSTTKTTLPASKASNSLPFRDTSSINNVENTESSHEPEREVDLEWSPAQQAGGGGRL